MRAALVILLFILPPQDERVDPVEVDKALDKATKWLKAAGGGSVGEWVYDGKKMTSTELILWTLLHAQVPEDDEIVQLLLQAMLKAPLQRTYCVSLQAMVLQHLDSFKYQGRIARCAQFLVDNQCKNGQWSYGNPVREDVETPPNREDVATPGKKDPDAKKPDQPPPDKKRPTVALPRITIKKRGEGPEKGDNSNSQYAALGLRACHDANIRVPRKTLSEARKWWESSQNDDGGWCYLGKGEQPSYGSMTAGAVSSLAALQYCSGSNPRSGKALTKGKQWLIDNFAVDGNPKHAYRVQHHYYYLYALERTGMFLEVEKLGDHRWYDEGARYLLQVQQKPGNWGDRHETCFAILFLRRASRPLRPVATKSARDKKK